MPVHGSDLAHLLYPIPLLCPCKFRLADLDTRPLTLVRWPSCLVLSFAVSRIMSDQALSPFDRLQHTIRQFTRTDQPAPDAQPAPTPHDTPDHGDGHAGDTASDPVSDPALLAPTDSHAMPSTSGVSQSPPSHPTAHVPLAEQPIEQSSASVSDPAICGILPSKRGRGGSELRPLSP